jgi:hypothetical protein
MNRKQMGDYKEREKRKSEPVFMPSLFKKTIKKKLEK